MQQSRELTRAKIRVLFIYVWFNDSISSSDYWASNNRMINEQWNGKDVEGSDRDTIWSAIAAFAWGDRKTTKILNQYSLFAGRDLNPGPPEY
jgi:hypothetical protein